MRFLWLALFLVFAACDSASPITSPHETVVAGVTFQVDRTEVPRGASLELALINGADRRLSMGSLGCSTVERLVENDWTVDPGDNEHACILPLYVLDPSEAQREAFTLDVAPGTVRLFHRFGFVEGDEIEIRSPAIRVLD